jgi:hypothetical protein
MIKKILFMAAMAISFFAASNQSSAHDPFPECNPCPFVK